MTCEPCPYLSRIRRQFRTSRSSQESAIATEALMNNMGYAQRRVFTCRLERLVRRSSFEMSGNFSGCLMDSTATSTSRPGQYK